MRLPFDALAPHGLWLLLGLVPLVLLYLLKVRRERVRVPSTWLWAQARRDLVARSPFQKLIPQVPLFLQAAALVFLALALSRISGRSEKLIGDSVAIVIDTSASMAALDGQGRTRIELAREAAKGAIGSLLPGSRAMVIDAGREARVVSSLDEDRRRLREAIDKLRVADIEGDLGAGVALAIERLRQEGGTKRIVVITDGALAKGDGLAHSSLPLDIVKVGDPVENVGIVRIDVRGGKDAVSKAEQVQIFAMLESFAERPREVFVTARLENTDYVLASRRLLVPPGERVPIELAFRSAPGDVGKGLIVDISPKDAFPNDDVAYARIPSGRRMPVVLVGDRPSPFVERALQSDPEIDLYRLSPSHLGGDTIPDDALVVTDGLCPPPHAEGLAFLVLAPKEGPCLGALVGKSQERPAITSWAAHDPRLRFLALDDIHIARASLLKPESQAQELIRTSEGAIVVDASSQGRDVTIVGFDVGESDWPLKASFVLFVRNIAEQARSRRALGIASSLRAGEPMRLHLPPSAESVRVEGPEGFVAEASIKDGLAVIPGPRRAGLYHVSFRGQREGSAVVAANLVSSRESDLRERPIEAPRGEAAMTEGSRIPEKHTDWTWLFALLALGFLVADVLWLTRRPKLAGIAEAPKPKLPERRRA